MVCRLSSPTDQSGSLTVELTHGFYQPGNPVNLGHFRLSFSFDHEAITKESLQATVKSRVLSATHALAVAYLLYGSHERALRVLQRSRRTVADSSLTLLLTSRAHHLAGQAVRAREDYERFMTSLKNATIPRAFDAWTISAMTDSGGMDRETATLRLEELKKHRAGPPNSQ